MSVLVVYSRLYADCAARASRSIARSPWTLLLPMAIATALQFLAILVLSAVPGLIAGLVLSLAADALFSSYLYFLDELVSDQKVSIREFSRSIGRYFWSVVNLQFVLWIASWVLGLAVGRSAQGALLLSALWLVAAVVLNAAPEIIYQRGTYGGLQTIQACWEFIKESWIEWFIPNVPLLFALAVVYVFSRNLGSGVSGLVLSSVLTGAVFHWVMTFRGQLFGQLVTSSHRQRMFKYQNR